MNADAISQRAIVVNSGAVPYRAIVADAVSFADYHVVAGLEPVADFDRGVNHASGADLRAIADTQGFALDRTAWG